MRNLSERQLNEVVGGVPSWLKTTGKVVLKPLAAGFFALDAQNGYSRARNNGESVPNAVIEGGMSGLAGIVGADGITTDGPPPPRVNTGLFDASTYATIPIPPK